MGGSALTTEEAQANNEKFTVMFKENASASETKNLITLIRNNNNIAENDREGLGYIYVLLNGKECSPTKAYRTIINGKRYEITTPNDNTIKEKAFLKNNEYNANNKDLSAAYYYNRYLRVISINELQESQINIQNTINK